MLAYSAWDPDDIIQLFLAVSFSGIADVEFAQVKFEVVDIATDFIPKTYAEELRDCQRYFEKITLLDEGLCIGFVRSATSVRGVFDIKEKRVASTVSYTGDIKISYLSTLVVADSASFTVNEENRVRIDVVTPAVLTPGQAVLVYTTSVNAFILVDAEF